jgi:hypothetical protein
LPESEPVAATLAELVHTLDLNELSLTDVDLLRGEAGGAHEWIEVDQLLTELEVSASDMKRIKKALMWRWRTDTEQLTVSEKSQRDFAERKAAQLTKLVSTLESYGLDLTDIDSLRGEAGGANEWNEIDEVLAEVEASASAKKGIKAALAWRWRAEVEQLAVAAQSELHVKAGFSKRTPQRRP